MSATKSDWEPNRMNVKKRKTEKLADGCQRAASASYLFFSVPSVHERFVHHSLVRCPVCNSPFQIVPSDTATKELSVVTFSYSPRTCTLLQDPPSTLTALTHQYLPGVVRLRHLLSMHIWSAEALCSTRAVRSTRVSFWRSGETYPSLSKLGSDILDHHRGAVD
jgi:hypothetical protein